MKGPCFYDDDFFIIAENNKNLIEDIKRILLTIPGERPNNPDFGSYLRYYLFESSNKVSNELTNVIKNDIEKWIPTVEVLNNTIEISDGHNARLTFTVLDYQLSESFDYDLSIQF